MDFITKGGVQLVMNNYDHSEETGLIFNKGIGEQSEKHFREFLVERRLDLVYGKFIIPVYQEIFMLREEKKISTTQFNERISSIMGLLKLVDDIMSKDFHYHSTAILLIENTQKSPVYLKIMQGLFRSEYINPILVEDSISSDEIQQLIINYKADTLIFINSAQSDELINIPHLNKVKSKNFSYDELEQFMNSLTITSDESIQFSDWLYGENSI